MVKLTVFGAWRARSTFTTRSCVAPGPANSSGPPAAEPVNAARRPTGDQEPHGNMEEPEELPQGSQQEEAV